MNYTELITVLEEKLDLKDVPQEVKENVFIHLGDSILERTMLAIVSSLSEEEAKLASEQLHSGDIEAFLSMIQDNHPELNTIVVTITNEVISEFVELSKE